MNNDRRRNSDQGRWLSNEEFDELVKKASLAEHWCAVAQMALGMASACRKSVAETDDRVAEFATFIRDELDKAKKRRAPKREQVL